MTENVRLPSPCVRCKFADWDVLAAMLGLLGVAWVKTVLLKDNYHREGYCMCCLNYKGKEVEGHELKLHRLTADKKLKSIRWSPLSETGQKSDSLFATIIHTALFYTIYFISDRILSVSWCFWKLGWGCIFKKIHNKITQPRCYHYCFYTTDVRPNPNPISIIKLSLYFVIFNL